MKITTICFFLIILQYPLLTKAYIKKYSPYQSQFWIYLIIAIAIIISAGICSGLTIGYLSIDRLTLQLKIKNGTKQQKQAAQAIIPLLNNHHILLSTLLVANALAMQSLPIFLNKIVPASGAVIISTICVLVFGQLIPQALCTGEYQIIIAKRMAPIVKILIVIFYVISKPIGYLLDKWLGVHKDVTRFTTKNLIAILELHKDKVSNPNKSLGFNPEQIDMLQNTMKLRQITAEKVMIKIHKAFLINQAWIVKDILKKIRQSNFSLIPIYRQKRENIIGFIRTKELIKVKEDKEIMIKDIAKIFPPVFVEKNSNLLQIFKVFKDKKFKLLFVVDQMKNDQYAYMVICIYKTLRQQQRANVLGMISLKEVFEKITLKQFGDYDIHNKEKIISIKNLQLKAFKKEKDNEIKQAIEEI